MTDAGGAEVLAAGEGPRGRRGWWVAAAVVAALLVFSTLRAGDDAPAPSASPTATAGPVFPSRPEEPELPAAPALSAPPYRGRLPLVVAGEREARGGGGRFDAGERTITSFVPLRDGFALVVTEDPQVTANPARLVIQRGAAREEVVVDEDSTLFAAVDRSQFWMANGYSGDSFRFDVTGRVAERIRVPRPWTAVGATDAGLVVVANGGVATFRPGGPPELLDPDAEFLGTDGRRVLTRIGTCRVGLGCVLIVQDARTRLQRRVVPTNRDFEFPRAVIGPGGGTVAFVASDDGAFTVAVAHLDERPVPIVVTPPGTEAVGTFYVDWLDRDRLVVFEVRDSVRPFVYDLRTRSLAAGEAFDLANPGWLSVGTA